MNRRQKKLRFSKWLRGLFRAEARDESERRILVEPLEARQLLAGDAFSALLSSSHTQLFSDLESSEESATQASSLGGEGELIAEGEPAPDLVAFAKALADSGTQFFGAAWCPFCTEQDELFEDGGKYLPFIEVTDANRNLNSIGIAEGINEFPTWEFPDGTRLTGVQTLETLSNRAGVPIPQSEAPTFDELPDTTVLIGSPLHIPVDAYDPNDGPLTIQVTSSDPSILEADVLQNNRSLRLDMAGYGDMVFELFENRAPVPSGRVIELAESGFYDGVIFHRVIDNFVIQGGDPTGTGAGGSQLGDFDDQFHVDLQHNRTGVLSFAKSTDDTNDSQFFITEGPQRFLDFNHSVFGQLVEGESVREAISGTATNASDRPLNTVTIESASVFEDNENGVVVLRGKQSGTADVTVTVTDADGNSSSQTFTATVAADNANGTPFLNPVPPVETDINTPVTINLSAQDKEDDTLIYSVQPLGNQTFGLDVDSATGEVTVTPPTDFIGQLQFRATVRQQEPSSTSSKDDNQVITVQVAQVETPTGIDLSPESDSGVSDSDNTTNATSLKFVVDGTLAGATVEIRVDGQVVGSATATGTSTEVTVANVSALGEGSVSFTASQTLGGDVSPFSNALSVILDRTPPAQIAAGVLPSSAVVDTPVAVDIDVAGEGQGLVYTLTSGPAGMSLNPNNGQLEWTPASSQVGNQPVGISLTDIAGNTTAQDFSISVVEDPLVALDLSIVDSSGQPLSTIGVGDTFIVQISVEDLRGFGAEGVFGAYMDLLYDSDVVEPVANTITYIDPYTNGPKGSTATSGLIDELGAFSGSNNPLGGGVRALAEVEFRAIAVGSAGLVLEAADDPGNDILLYGLNEAVSLDRVTYGTSSFTVGLDFELVNDTFNFDEDSGLQNLAILDNDTISGSGSLTIVNVTTPTSGAQLSIAADGQTVNYIPAPNFTGADLFTYTAENQNGVSSEATVTIQVADVNDPPVALNDSFSVTENSSNNVLDVLANDNSGDDDANLETLSIENVIAGSISGSVSVRADQTLSYTPAADFTGTETFSYTLSDGRGGTSVATVTVNVDVANPPPNAQDDSFSLSEDDPQASFDVLANDSTDDATETLSISDVGTSSEGSVVQVAGDGQSILYTPAADFNGTEVITYTLQDSGGATATAEVTFAVGAVNDAPQAVNDTETALAGDASTTIEVLDNDLDIDGDELTIIEVTQPGDGNGTISIASDGKSLLYEPPSDDFESLISFSYTVEDPSGETDTATVEIDVRDFVPFSISGDAFDASTLSTGGFDVRLTGNDFAGNVVSRSATVGVGNATGYQFADLPPGNYMLERDPLPFLWDSGESIEIVAAMDGGDIQQDLSIAGSLRPQFFDIRDFLGSSFGNSLAVAMHDDGSVAWSMGSGEWSELSTLDVQLDDDDVLNVAAVDTQSRNLSGELTLNEASSRAYQAGVQTPYRLLRVPGTPAAAGIEEEQSASTGEGEAASGTPLSDNTLVGEGEAFPTPRSNSDSVQSSSTLPAPTIASVSTTEAVSVSRLSSATLSRRMSLASADNESSSLNQSPMSQVAVDEAMKSVLPKLEVALSPSLEDALLGSSDMDSRDQAILQL